ncbi:hypothetical protein HDU86_006715 [Geranomyces michiganensis]|nr:hypothetical protein HDU86_006715 [Geranomyces michiganensis]
MSGSIESAGHSEARRRRHSSGIETVISLPNGIEIDRWQPAPLSTTAAAHSREGSPNDTNSNSNSNSRPSHKVPGFRSAVLVDHRTRAAAPPPRSAAAAADFESKTTTTTTTKRPCKFFGRGPRSCLAADRCPFLHESPSLSSTGNNSSRRPPIVVSARAEFEEAARALERASRFAAKPLLLEEQPENKKSVEPDPDPPPPQAVQLHVEKSVEPDPDPPPFEGVQLPVEKSVEPEPDSPPPQGVQLSVERNVCVIFQTLGACNFGSGCPDLHQIGDNPLPTTPRRRALPLPPLPPPITNEMPSAVAQEQALPPLEAPPLANLTLRRVSVIEKPTPAVREKVARPRSVSPSGNDTRGGGGCTIRCKRWQTTGKCVYGNRCFYKDSHIAPGRIDERIIPPRPLKKVKIIHLPSPERSASSLNNSRRSSQASSPQSPPSLTPSRTDKHDCAAPDDSPPSGPPRSRALSRESRCGRWEKFGNCHFGDRCLFKDTHFVPGSAAPKDVSLTRMPNRCRSPSPLHTLRQRLDEEPTKTDDSPHSRETTNGSSSNTKPYCTEWKWTGSCRFGVNCRYRAGHITHHTRPAQTNAVLRKIEISRSASPETSLPPKLRSASDTLDGGDRSPPKRFNNSICRQMEMTGDCQFGKRCWYDHPEPVKKWAQPKPQIEVVEKKTPPPETSSPSKLRSTSDTLDGDRSPPKRFNNNICRQMEMTGECQFGKRCWYDHPEPVKKWAQPKPQTEVVEKKTPPPETSSPSKLRSTSDTLDSDHFPRKRLNNNICRQMEMTGECQFGKRCWYDHPEPVKKWAQPKPQIEVVEKKAPPPVQSEVVGGSGGGGVIDLTDDNKPLASSVDLNSADEVIASVPADEVIAGVLARFREAVVPVPVLDDDAAGLFVQGPNQSSSPRPSEDQNWDAYAGTWDSPKLGSGSYRRDRPDSGGGSRGSASTGDAQSASGRAASDAGNNNPAHDSTAESEQRATAAITLANQCFSLYKGQGVFVATVQLVNVSMPGAVERGLAQELAQDGALCVAHMVPLDYMEDAVYDHGSNVPYDHAAFKAILPFQTEEIKTVATYLSVAKRAGVVALKYFTLFILPASNARSLFNIDVDGEAFLYCVAMRNTGSTPGTLKTSGNRRPLKLASPFLASVEVRQAYLQATYGLPEKFQWLVDGRSVFILSPDDIVPTTEMHWLVNSHGGRVQAQPREDCNLILCHRRCHQKIGLLPNLLALKKNGAEFVLWGHSSPSLTQNPMQLFPGSGGIVSFTEQSMASPDGLELLRGFAHFTKMQNSTSQWLCVLHPHLVNTYKSCAAGETADAVVPQAVAAQAMFYIYRLEAAECLIIATEGQVYDEKAHLTGPVREFALLVRLQIQWSLNFRNFVLLTADDGRRGDDGSAGILEMTVVDFMRFYRLNRTVAL